MKQTHRLNVSVASTVKTLIAEAEAAAMQDPSMAEAAGLVYVGDIYSLREEIKTGKDNGWGKRSYVCSAGVPGL
jgi:hypothetical protein